MDNFLASLRAKAATKRIYWAIMTPIVGVLGWKAGGWGALSLFFLGTLLYERGGYVLANIRFLELINEFLSQIRVDYKYKLYRVIYEIHRDNKDSWSREMEIIPEGSFVTVKAMWFGSSGGPATAITDFDTLDITAYTPVGRVGVFPTQEATRDNKWYVNLLFTAPIGPKEEARKVFIQGQWPNLWKKLRETGADTGAFKMEKESEKLELVLVFPPGVTKAALIPEQQDRGTIREEHDKRGRLQKVWSIEKVQREEKFSYIVKCEQLPALVEKYLNKRTRRSSLQ